MYIDFIGLYRICFYTLLNFVVSTIHLFQGFVSLFCQQVFIGHSENVSRIIFTPDYKNLLSVGEALYLWDFMAYRPPSPSQ